jgi:cytochrome bd-type quinol oxidase subunit 2
VERRSAVAADDQILDKDFLGLPFVLSYTVVVYWVFRGKVRLGKFSY